MSESFESIKERLDSIVEAVSDDDLPIDQALQLYEEAVSLGLKASSLLEQDVLAGAEEAGEGDQAAAANGSSAAKPSSPAETEEPSHTDAAPAVHEA